MDKKILKKYISPILNINALRNILEIIFVLLLNVTNTNSSAYSIILTLGKNTFSCQKKKCKSNASNYLFNFLKLHVRIISVPLHKKILFVRKSIKNLSIQSFSVN